MLTPPNFQKSWQKWKCITCENCMPMFETIQVDLKKSEQVKKNKKKQKPTKTIVELLEKPSISKPQNRCCSSNSMPATRPARALPPRAQRSWCLAGFRDDGWNLGTPQKFSWWPHPLIFENVCVNILYICIYVYVMYRCRGLRFTDVYIQIFTYCKVLGKNHDFGNLTV